MTTPTIVGHHDALFRLSLSGDWDDFLKGSEDGQVDLQRAREANVSASFFACWPESTDDGDEAYPSAIEVEDAVTSTRAMVEILLDLESASEGSLQIVRSLDGLRECLSGDCHGAVLHFEGAEALGENLEYLDSWYEQGLRSLGIVWSRPNAFGHGVPFLFPSTPDTGPGLTSRGLELVKACNSLGIMLDVSHLNEAGFWDLEALTDAPIVATHSNAHALCPASRNLTDDQLRAIAGSGGLVGINFSCSDLRSDGEEDPDTSMGLVLEQFDYVAGLIGVDHVALGTDLDGAVLPNELDGMEKIPDVLSELARTGWTEDEIEKMAAGNWLRVLQQTWEN